MDIIQGDALTVLPTLPAGRFHVCITSPPYWSLRDYQLPPTGWPAVTFTPAAGLPELTVPAMTCCLGLEPEPWQFVAHLVLVFREVRRVLRDDGVCWLNLGDSYNSNASNYQDGAIESKYNREVRKQGRFNKKFAGLKPKDLIGIPWMCAKALQADGWWLRSDVIWSKCLSGGTVIYAKTQKGEMPMTIKDMVRLDPSTVQLWNGKKWTQAVGWKEAEPEPDRKRKSSRVRSARHRGKETAVEGDIELILRNGERIGCTREHRWPTQRGLIAAEDLTISDVIQTTTIPEPDSPMPTHLPDYSIGWFLGTYLADGSRGKGGKVIQIASNINELDRFDKLRWIAQDYDGTCQKHQTSDNGMTINIYSPVLTGIIDTYISGNSAKTKHLSMNCWQRNNLFLSQILEGYLAGDGYWEENTKRWSLGFTSNDQLAQDLRTISARLGYSLRLWRTIHKIGDKEYPGWQGNLFYDGSRRRNPDTEIVAIKQSRARKFWDIAVEDEPHLFALASGILTHNSKPMPESVTDRPTKAHEYVFLLAKSGTPQFWTHRDLPGVRSKPAPDLRWIHADGHELTEPPDDPHWKRRKVDCPECGGSGKVATGYNDDGLFGGQAYTMICERCTGNGRVKAWEKVNLWRGHDYFYDADAVREAASEATIIRSQQGTGTAVHSESSKIMQAGNTMAMGGSKIRLGRNFKADVETGRNRRTVWEIATESYKGAHFATFPQALVEPCILASTSARGCCPACGAGWARVVEDNRHITEDGKCSGCRQDALKHTVGQKNLSNNMQGINPPFFKYKGHLIKLCSNKNTTGWRPTCDCDGGDPEPCIVIDPFFGSGTTGRVSIETGRRYVGIEMSEEYIELARKRLAGAQPALIAKGLE